MLVEQARVEAASRVTHVHNGASEFLVPEHRRLKEAIECPAQSQGAASTSSTSPGGIALGIDGGAVFDQTLEVSDVQLERGDALILYTDGIVEAMNDGGVEYGLEAFARVLQNLNTADPQSIVDGVLADLEAHVAGAEPTDDITLVVARRE